MAGYVGSPTGGGSESEVHGSEHEDGGSDEISVDGLSGDLADAQDPKSHGDAAHSVDYANDPHDNAQHSETYLTAADVEAGPFEVTEDGNSPFSVSGGSIPANLSGSYGYVVIELDGASHDNSSNDRSISIRINGNSGASDYWYVSKTADVNSDAIDLFGGHPSSVVISSRFEFRRLGTGIIGDGATIRDNGGQPEDGIYACGTTFSADITSIEVLVGGGSGSIDAGTLRVYGV